MESVGILNIPPNQPSNIPGKVIALNMLFDENSCPDFGDITIAKNGDFVLLQEDTAKLLTNVTRNVCGTAFSVPVGQRAVVVDTGEVYVYHADDRWYPNGPQTWKNPEKYHAGYVNFKLRKNNANYVLNNETVTLKVTDESDHSITEQTVTTANYMGDGYYVVWLNILEARKLKNISVTTIDIKIKNGATDITSTFDISCIEIQEWVNEIKYGE